MTTRVYGQFMLWVLALTWSASVAQAQCVTYQPWSTLAWPGPAYAPGVVQRSCFKIEMGACVELDTDVHVDSLWVAGALRFVDGADRVLNAHKILLDGVMEVGIATDRFTSNAALELTDLSAAAVHCVDAYTVNAAGVITGPTAPETDFHPVDIQNRTFLVRGAATLDMHGKRRASTWKFLAATAYPASVPVPGEPYTVKLLRGERTVLEETLGESLPAGPPASALEWYYDAADPVAKKVWLRLDAQTDPTIDRANAAVLLLF